jgi:hypothetical protein
VFPFCFLFSNRSSNDWAHLGALLFNPGYDFRLT